MGTDQKVAVITGASQGIGAALVRAYRDRNYRVVGTARSIRPSDDDQVLAVPGDIADRKTAERAISEGVARFGRIDTLVNNEGWALASAVAIAAVMLVWPPRPRPALRPAAARAFTALAELLQAELEGIASLEDQVNEADHAIAGVPSVLASLTKGGLAAATKSLAIEYARRGIRVNAVAPGIIKSPMNPVDTYAQLDALHPVGHMGEISDIVGAILYLESAPFVTGEILHTDGGQSAGH